jgi:hypothetical protein
MHGKAMKRSDMITSIEILLESIGYTGPSTSGEDVVALIEALGMLPPETMNPKAVGLNYISMVHGGIGSTVNAWEPEDSVLT